MRTSPNDPKSRPGRSKMPAGAQSDDQGLPQAVPGRSGNAPKLPRNAPGWLRGCAAGTLGGANGVRGASGNPPEGSREAPKAISYAVVDQHAPRSARAKFFRRPRCFAQTSRHAIRLSFNGVLTEFDEVRVTHARAAWELAKRSFGHGKSKPGGRPSEPKRPPGAAKLAIWGAKLALVRCFGLPESVKLCQMASSWPWRGVLSRCDSEQSEAPRQNFCIDR